MKPLLDRIARLRLLVVGDVMLDHYVWGDASRISPEAPVPVVKVERDTYAAGGAANVALNLRALGAAAELVGVTGADTWGERLAGLLNRSGVTFDGRLLRPGIATIRKTRVMCRNQQLCRLDREAGRDAYRLPADVAEAFLAERVRQADAVIVSDYAKGVVTGDLVRRVQELAGPDKLVAVDPKPRADLTFEGVGLMTPNRAEALQLAHCTDADTTGFPAETVCSRIYAAYRPALLVITLGADGMLISTQGRPDRQVSTAAREVFDVSGAGDTVIAVLTAALAAHATPDEAVHLANLAAGVVVGKIGTATATAAEILAYASRT